MITLKKKQTKIEHMGWTNKKLSYLFKGVQRWMERICSKYSKILQLISLQTIV